MPRPPIHPGSWHRTRADFQRRIRSPKAREIGLAFCDAMIAWQQTGGPTPSLDLLSAAIDSGSSPVSHNAAHQLGAILPHHAPRSDAFNLAADIWRRTRALGRSRMAWEADSICAAMTRAQAVQFRKLGLHDRSKRVRGDAAYVAAKCGLRELLPELLTMTSADPDPNVRHHSEISFHLLDRGYLIKPFAYDAANYDEITVLCTNRDATLGTLRMTVFVKRSVVESLGIDEVVAQLRRHEADLSPLPWDE
ncbi:MAG: hypothetical protein HND58_05025 [Planctomycetota bacterium]|nr:MAG: hypothetical protein HND58_05025 [Planctomycetota bacterium]